MRAGGVVVRETPTQQTSEVPFVEHDDVIEAFPLSRWLWGVTRHGLRYGPWNEAATDSVSRCATRRHAPSRLPPGTLDPPRKPSHTGAV
jgi:hypothetical protein